uniref:Uncharacterized protein n=1 Tax=Magallana gigas TaxID=29159 RepID=K1RCJ2_MAGGI
MDWMLTRCEEVDEEGLSGNEADSEDEGYNDEIADPDNLLLNMVLHSCNDEYDIVPICICTYTLQGGGLRPNTPNASKCRGMWRDYLVIISAESGNSPGSTMGE